MFTSKGNPFASLQPFRDEAVLPKSERGVPNAFSENTVPQALVAPAAVVATQTWDAGEGGGSRGQENGHQNAGSLSSWEACLKAREEALRQREQAVSTAEGQAGRNNWPRCRPFMRHSISEDVPVNRQGLVTRGYWAWIFAAAGCCVDWITITLMFIVGHKGLGDWLFCTIISGAGLPLSFLLWHRSLYKSAIKDGACMWAWFFLLSAMHVGLAAWTFIGPPIVGKWAAGVFTMIDQFKSGGGAGIFFGICCVINVVLWGLSGLLGFAVWGVSRIPNYPTLATSAGGYPRASKLKHQCKLVLKHAKNAKHAKDIWYEEGEGAPPCGNGWAGC
ncbi:hypothetical protein CVIRNUC_008104 [Coccomyxa viridis]|uniref:Secretory carrier-associated membrane protein n=1 Tax=Coccomyxa viridis TaxID=1274662 RepID=A0AAV1ICY2_9CHLO|nr:hypothetical protein CVIRNUC_008104 [Coccomyxa viridis]